MRAVQCIEQHRSAKGMAAAEWLPKCVTWFIGLQLISVDLHHPVQAGACPGWAVPHLDLNRAQQLCPKQQLEAEIDVSGWKELLYVGGWKVWCDAASSLP